MIDQNCIHIFIVGFHGNRIYQMKEKVICYIMVYGCYGLLNEFLQLFNPYCSNLLNKPMVRGLTPCFACELMIILTYLLYVYHNLCLAICLHWF